QFCLDYQSATLWLKPTKQIKDEFLFDRSGLSIIASGFNLNYFTVLNVLPGSPADEAGIHAGDRIMRIGFWAASMRTLAELNGLLQQKPGKKVKIVVKRNGEVMKKQIILRDLI
ncbi:MAG: PDZ domain-containing protein, partial [Saprospiraceae bacterium]|nr:PDZ domain-containing protein [Saprospiraceae bacterium]